MKLAVPVIGILRGVDSDFFGELMEASFGAGLEAIEVTMNTLHAEKIVSKHQSSVPLGKYLGMGTIRNINEAKKAVDAGASFLISPNTDFSVIEYAKSQNIPIIAGALTPTEIYNAWSAGADMVKVFPCSGPEYIKNILGPFDQIELVAVGGVSISNLKEYFNAGAKAVGVSSSLFGREALLKKNIVDLTQNVKTFVGHCNNIKY